MYWIHSGSLLEPVLALILGLMIWRSGWTLCAGLLRVRPWLQPVAGLACGGILFLALGWLLSYLIPLLYACGLAVLIIYLASLWPWWRSGWKLERPRISALGKPGLAFLLLVLFFMAAQRGLTIFDEEVNLPVVSWIATGHLPPYSIRALDNLSFGQHWLAAVLVGLGGFFPWSALDLLRALTLAWLPLLAYGWLRSITRQKTLALVSAAFLFLAGGTRWLLLLLPASLLLRLSSSVEVVHSAVRGGTDLYTALGKPWSVAGGPPAGLPFAFVGAVLPPAPLALDWRGALPWVILLLLLLTVQRRWQPLAGILFGILLGGLACADAWLFVGVFSGLLLIWLGRLFCGGRCTGQARRRTLSWGWVCLPAALVGLAVLVSGGVQQSLGLDRLLLRGSPEIVADGFFVSLSLVRPAQLLVFLFEAGPASLLLPWAVVIAWRGIQRGRLLWGALGFAMLMELGVALWVADPQYSPFNRHTSAALFLAVLLCLPAAGLAWPRWGTWQRGLAVSSLAVMAVSGIVVLGFYLTAFPLERLAAFVQPGDAYISSLQWNRLPADSRVLDAQPERSAVLFGVTSGTQLNESRRLELVARPDPVQVKQAGYRYLYMDRDGWRQLDAGVRQALEQPCVKRTAEWTGADAAGGKDFRWLLDLQSCR